MAGYIYFARTQNWSRGVKIGYSKDPETRMETLRSEVGAPLVLLGKIPGTPKDEKIIHSVLHHRRLHGEWFFGTSRYYNGFVQQLLDGRIKLADLHKKPEVFARHYGGEQSICACGRVVHPRKSQ